MTKSTPARPAQTAPAYRSDSIVTNGAARIVAAYRERLSAYMTHEATNPQVERVEVLYTVVSTPALWLSVNPGTPADVRADLAWHAVAYALFALDMMETAGAVGYRARWAGDGRHVLGVALQSARYVLGFYDDETTLNFQLGYLEATLGKLPEGFGRWANTYPTPM